MGWHKSSFSSSSNCVEWRRASECLNGNCVEVGSENEEFLVRDTKDREGGTLRFTKGEWNAFVEGVKAGEFDV